MWQATHELSAPGLTKEAVWATWADVDRWHEWDTDLEFAKLTGTFREGAELALRPKGGPTVKIRIVRSVPLCGFTDLTTFPLAKMYGIHDMVETPEGLKLTMTVRIEGSIGVVVAQARGAESR
jgi:hypothetical protein